MPALDFTLRAFEPEDFPALTGLLNQPRVVWGTLQLPFGPLRIAAAAPRAAIPNSSVLRWRGRGLSATSP